MSSNVVNQVAFLRTSRDFPEESKELSIELEKAYLDTANAVNTRTIGIYPATRPAITGNSYFFDKNQRQQSLRQVYLFTAAGNIPHGINALRMAQLVSGYGSYTDGTSAFGVIFASSTAIAGQVTFYVTSTNIVVLLGAGAPAIVSGKLVIEWISAP